MASDHYTPVKPTASVDGESADAADINSISDAVETAFETLEAEIDALVLGSLNPTNEATDTSCFIPIFKNATGLQDIYTNSNLTYNSASAILGVSTLSLAGGSITDSSGTIDFGDEDLDTTGGITASSLVINGYLTCDDVTINGSTVSVNGFGTLSHGNNTVTALTFDGSNGKFDAISMQNGFITDTTGTVDFANDDLHSLGDASFGGLTITNGIVKLTGSKFYIQTNGTAAAPIAGYAQFWIYSDGTPRYTDPSGTTYTIDITAV